MNRVPGIALTGFAAVFVLLALTPAGASFIPNGGGSPAGYGMAEVVHRDGGGEVVSSQIVHNRLVDTGEALMIQGTFGTLADNEKPTVMCIHSPFSSTASGLFRGSGDIFDASFFGSPLIISAGPPTCVDAYVDITTEPSLAVLYATFEGTTNLDADGIIGAILVCNTANSATDKARCIDSGELFAAVQISNQTVGANDTVNISYTFDLTSPKD